MRGAARGGQVDTPKPPPWSAHNGLAATESRVRPVDIRHLSVDNGPMSIDNGPMSVDNGRMSVDNRPMSVDNRPMSVANRRMSVDNRRMSVDNRRMSVDNRRMSVDIALMSAAPHPLSTADRAVGRGPHLTCTRRFVRRSGFPKPSPCSLFDIRYSSRPSGQVARSAAEPGLSTQE